MMARFSLFSHRYLAAALVAATGAVVGWGGVIRPMVAHARPLALSEPGPPSTSPSLVAATATFQAGVSRQAEPLLPKGQPAGSGVVGLDLRLPPRAAAGYPLVAAVLPGTPASRCGLKPGDLIVAVDGQDTYGLGRQALDEAIGDRPGQVIIVVVARGERVLPPMRLTVAAVSTLAKASRSYFSP
jgi:membrane-associated protease RseP (regulator of RpoE activity)